MQKKFIQQEEIIKQQNEKKDKDDDEDENDKLIMQKFMKKKTGKIESTVNVSLDDENIYTENELAQQNEIKEQTIQK